MLRSALLFGLALLPATPADFTVCIPVQTPPPPPVVYASYPRTVLYDGMPPPTMRGASSQSMRIVFGHVELCGKPNIPDHPDARFEACIRNDGIVYLPNPCDYGDREEFARLACHEQAHMAWHWPPDHGARA